MNEPLPTTIDLGALTSLFFDDPSRLARFEAVTASAMPEVYRKLLAHEHHMTVTVEKHHHAPVDVEVLDRRTTPTHYARKILLRRTSDGRVVQFGIMRVRLDVFRPPVRDEILAAETPLGRILIRHNVFRSIHLSSLWRVVPGDELRDHFGPGPWLETFGRTALITCDDEPAIELLEIVAPEE